jgi:hypothetical protein
LRSTQPAAAPHAPPHSAPAPGKEPAAEEGLWAHAQRVLRAKAGAAAAAILDPAIAFLQRVRRQSVGDGGAAAESEEDRHDSRRDRPGAQRSGAGARSAPLPDDSAETPVAAPPKRRLRGFLVYLSVMLAGGMGGGALAYDLLARLLANQAAETRRVEAASAKQAKAAASAQKQAAEAEAKLSDSLAEHARVSSELQQKLAEAEKRQGPSLAAEATAAAKPPPKLAAAPVRAAGKARPLRVGNCNLSQDNVAALKDCIEVFNQ